MKPEKAYIAANFFVSASFVFLFLVGIAAVLFYEPANGKPLADPIPPEPVAAHSEMDRIEVISWNNFGPLPWKLLRIDDKEYLITEADTIFHQTIQPEKE